MKVVKSDQQFYLGLLSWSTGLSEHKEGGQSFSFIFLIGMVIIF